MKINNYVYIQVGDNGFNFQKALQNLAHTHCELKVFSEVSKISTWECHNNF